MAREGAVRFITSHSNFYTNIDFFTAIFEPDDQNMLSQFHHFASNKDLMEYFNLYRINSTKKDANLGTSYGIQIINGSL